MKEERNKKSRKIKIKKDLESMGFEQNYINAAFEEFEKQHGDTYKIENIVETVIRLKNKNEATETARGGYS